MFHESIALRSLENITVNLDIDVTLTDSGTDASQQSINLTEVPGIEKKTRCSLTQATSDASQKWDKYELHLGLTFPQNSGDTN